jgi:hypothetical protein
MENKKQSSIEWFNQQIIDRQNGEGDSRNWDMIFQQAKEIHKQEIKESWVNGLLSDCLSEENEDLYAEDYYNLTFNPQEDDKV